MKNLLFLKTKSHKKVIFNVKKALFAVFLFVFLLNCTSSSKKSFEDTIRLKEQIIFSMAEQEQAWNEGDLEAFMKHYWKSDSLVFIGKSGLNKGWQTTLDNYKKSYKNKEEMGTLKFTNKSIDFLGEESIFVIGEWKLERKDSLGDLQGMYSLIWQNKNGDWVITADHSS